MFGAYLVGSASPVAAATIDQAAFAGRKRLQALPSGINLAYVELGNPKGRPVVFIHGYTDNARTWTLLAPYLSPSLRIILIDLRGHGASSKPDCCYSLNDMAGDVAALLRAKHIKRADIVGHSLGSAITQVFAETYPQMSRRVVLISSTLGGPPPKSSPPTPPPPSASGTFDLSTGIAALKDPIDPDSEFMRAWYSSPTPVDETFLSYERRDSASIPVRVWNAVLQQGSMAGLRSSIGRLKAPVLILSGDKDPFFGPAVQADLKHALPRSEAYAFPDFGHNLIWEGPQAVAEKLNAFLTR